MNSPEFACNLDEACARAAADVRRRALPEPQVLYWLGTGAGMLPAQLVHPMKLPLGKLGGVPASWSDALLCAGELGGTRVWLIEDAHDTPDDGASPTWARGFPCWLAARCGAAVCVHVSAGVSLPNADFAPDPGTFVLAADHVNISGQTPLVGLSRSKLGPMFPDTSWLHYAPLRERALSEAHALGLRARAGVVACVLGPALETNAERTFWARAGASVAVQELVHPLLASAHAGLAALSIVAVTDRGEGLNDLRGVVAQIEAMAPGLEDLLVALAPAAGEAAEALGIDE
ncbi:MAG: hypothetical protein ACKVWV_08895 [Planctomycetota bacterium]